MTKQRISFISALLFVTLIGGRVQASEPDLLTPNEAITKALSEPLQFVGFFHPSSSISRIPSCVFRNSHVTLMYTYCRQKEAPALGLTIYDNDIKRGNISFYTEGDGSPVSELKRTEYAYGRFRILSRENLGGYKNDFSAVDYGQYYEKEIYYYTLGCQIWQSGHDYKLRADCTVPFKAQEKSWVDSSIRFWVEPFAEWYDLQKVMRLLVAATPVP